MEQNFKTVFSLLEEHKRLIEKRERIIKNVEYPWENQKQTISFVEELLKVNEEINDFLSAKIELK